MNFAIYLHSAAAPSIDSGEDFLVPATEELERFLVPSAKATLVPVRDLERLVSRSAAAALAQIGEPSMVLVVRRDEMAAVSFKITYEPLKPIVGVGPKTVEIETADKARLVAGGLIQSGERVTITENGRPISWEHLRDLTGSDADRVGGSGA